jgi:hypothetical protein
MLDRGGVGAQAGFTVVFCSGQHCRSPLPVRERLGVAVRGCPHGMLVSSPCLFGPNGCPGTTAGAPVLLAQRCAGDERRPLGPIHSLGPLRSHRDLDAVCDWLIEPSHDLPGHLDPTVRHRPAVSN